MNALLFLSLMMASAAGQAHPLPPAVGDPSAVPASSGPASGQQPSHPSPAHAQMPAPHWSTTTPEERGEEIVQRSALPLSDRLLAASERFLGTPYVISPLGEGQGKDADPTSRFDAVDCLTFVEESMALALSRKPEDFEPLLTQIRYQSTPTYEDRNHLMEASWIPSNLKKGLIQDVTALYGGADTVLTYKELTPRSWTSVSSLALELPVERQPKGRFGLSMIPLAKVLHHARNVPSGTLLVVIRSDLPLKATRITHVGFVVQKGKRTYLRHAARTFARTVDEDLESFLLRNSKYEKWKVDGIGLYAVKEAPRLLAH